MLHGPSSIGKLERDRLDRAQRRAAKIVLRTKDSDAHKNSNWLPLSMRRDMYTISLTFKYLRDPLQCFLKIIQMLLELSTNEGKWEELNASQSEN